MDGAGEPFIVKVYPRKNASDTISKGHTGYTVNRDNMTIFDVDSGFGAPEGAKILAVNGVNVSSWDEYLQMTTKADDPNKTRLEEWDLHLQLPRDDEQGGGASLSDGAEQPIFCQLPETTTELAVGFYNVVVCLNEINERGWKIKERRLKTDIAKAFQHHALDVLCLSALGQLNESLDSAFEGGIKT